MPDVADRNRDPQFPPPRLRTNRVQHPRAQNAQLELTDAALHAQEQPVVRTTRVVNAVEIDHPRLDEPAKLKQMMPIAAVAGEAGCVETQNGTDVSSAQPGYELLKTRTGHGSACGTTQIVIDHLDVAKSASPRFIDEFILSTLALKVKLNLSLSGLANVNNGLPLEQRGLATDQRPSSPLSSIATPAASIRRRTNREITVLRSGALIPLSSNESNAMPSWRGGLNLTIGCNAFLIASLLDDVRVVGVASPESMFP